jgi:hypothetical protein
MLITSLNNSLKLFKIVLPSNRMIFLVVLGIHFLIGFTFLIANEQMLTLDTRCLRWQMEHEAQREAEAENQKRVENLL